MAKMTKHFKAKMNVMFGGKDFSLDSRLFKFIFDGLTDVHGNKPTHPQSYFYEKEFLIIIDRCIESDVMISGVEMESFEDDPVQDCYVEEIDRKPTDKNPNHWCYRVIEEVKSSGRFEGCDIIYQGTFYIES